MTLTAFVFPKLRTVKTCLDKCLKSPISENPSTSNMINAYKHCPNLHYININWSLPYQLSWKKFLLLTWKILGLLVSTLSTDEKCPVVKRDKLTIPFQMQVPQKLKTFPAFFAAFFKSRRNFERPEEKDDPYSFFHFRNYGLRKRSQINV